MDLFSKGYKFLSELDDPKAEGPTIDLESSLDGVAEKWLGWARGDAQPEASANVEDERHRCFSEDSADNVTVAKEPTEPVELQSLGAFPPGVQIGEPSSDHFTQETFEETEEPEQAEQSTEAAENMAASGAELETWPTSGSLEEVAEPNGPYSLGCADSGGEIGGSAPVAFEPVSFEAEGGDVERSAHSSGPATPSTARTYKTQAEAGKAVEAMEELDSRTVAGIEGVTDVGMGVTEEGSPEAGADEAKALNMLLYSEPLPQHVSAATTPEDTRASEDGPAELRMQVAELGARLGQTTDQLKHRERQLADLSNVLADMEAREVARREQTQTVRTKATEAVRAAEREMQAARRRAEQAEASEKRLKQEARDMEQELHKAQDTWRERIKKAEAKAQELEKEAKEVATANATEVARLKARLRAQAAGSEETREELEAYKARAEEELHRLGERIRATAESEMQLRHELQQSEECRQQLQERAVELSGQLEHAQQAYSEAAREVGAMSLRLNELEFNQKADSHAEDVLRYELSSSKERLAEMEERFKECAWMRDHALKQAEETRAKLQTAEEAQALAQSKEVCDMNQASATAVSLAQAEVKSLEQQLQKIIEQHQTELHEQAEIAREEIDYLKRKNDEKDKRLEILTCERNALRYETAEVASSKPSRIAPKPSDANADKQLVDIEDGLSLKEVLSGKEQGSGAVKAFLADGDLVLKRFSKLLFASPTTRRIFYGYVLLLHIWIWVVLHRAAAVHSSHTLAKPIVPNAS